MADSASQYPADAPSELIDRLRAVGGEVLADEVSRGLYATDASMFQIMPLAVVLPRNRTEAVAAVRVCGELGVPMLPRGGGTSLSGQTIARAVVIDTSKYMNRLLELNVEERWARVEPGLVRDELNALLKPHGLQFAPDPATSDRANVGGMIANNAAGMRSIRYGMTIDHVVGVDLALPTGEILNLGPIEAEALDRKCNLRDREGEIYRGFRELINTHREEIRERYPKVRRRSGGYLLDAFVDGPPWNMAKLICGSEGTLGTILEATVHLEPLPKHSGLCVAHFADMRECLRAVAPIVGHGPSAVELLDGLIIRLARESLLTRDRCGFVEGEPAGILVIEAQSDDPGEVAATLKAIAVDLKSSSLGYACPIMLTAQDRADVWLMRKNGLGLMTTVKGRRKPAPFIEDAAVPLEVLPEYIEEVQAICERHGRPVSLFAHASVGLLHVRPLLDLHEPDEINLLKTIQDEVFERVVHCGGAWSGEHGDGLVRGRYNERFFGPQLYGAFKTLKRLFDPMGLMNPGKIVDCPPIENHLRYHRAYHQQFKESLFHYREDGGFGPAVEQCTGVGACRQTLAGTMCPSYIATRDEAHSTRGRANALRLAMTGQLGPEGMSSEGVKGVLDLCLSCKGCRQECPNHVDMSRMKADFLEQYHRAHGTTLRERMFAESPRLAALNSGPQAAVVNLALRFAPLRWVMDRWLGIDARRPMPTYAGRRLSAWFQTQIQDKARGDWITLERVPSRRREKIKVALFNDTYMEHHEPQVGRAAIEVLEAAGCEVELVNAGCCQRPAISKGLLSQARDRGLHTMQNLDVYARRGIPIIVCEPSCASALSEDLPDLIEDAELGRRVAAQVYTIEGFLEKMLREQRLELRWRESKEGSSRQILVHGHCHQKALYGTKALMGMLRRIPGAQVDLIDAGCCGMAGSFGYEKEHYELSVKVAEDRLLPALREGAPEAEIVACGFSCRHQIEDLTGRTARHAIEVVREALD